MNKLWKAGRCLARWGSAVALAGAAALAAAPAWAGPWRVTVDTSALAGLSGYLAFDFISAEPANGNAATIDAFGSDASLGVATRTGGGSGSLQAGPLTLGGGPFFNEWLQSVSSFGSSLVFDLELGEALPTGAPDQFSFFLLDDGQLPYETSDPNGAGALFVIDLQGAATAPTVFQSDFARVTVEALEPPPQGVPAPPTAALAALALLAAGLARRPQPRPC